MRIIVRNVVLLLFTICEFSMLYVVYTTSKNHYNKLKCNNIEIDIDCKYRTLVVSDIRQCIMYDSLIGSPISSINTRKLALKLKRLEQVRDVRIVKYPNATLHIVVKLVDIIAKYDNGTSGGVYVTDYGDVVYNKYATDQRFIDVIDHSNGIQLKEAPVLKLITSINGSNILLSNISKLEINNGGFMICYDTTGLKVIVGYADNLDSKIYRLRVYYNARCQLHHDSCKYIDLRFRKQIVVGK